MPEIPPEKIAEAVDHKVTESRPVEPVTVAIIGTGDGGRLPTGTIATTEGKHEPNLVVQVIAPLMAILIRFINAYLTMLVGLLTAAGFSGGKAVGAADFYHAVVTCAVLSLAGPCVGLLKDCITIFGRLEAKFPLLTGSV